MSSSTNPTPYKKFDFGVTFGGDGVVTARTARPKRAYTPEEVEEIRANAYNEGLQDFNTQAQMANAQAVQALADAAQAGLSHLQEAIFAHKQASIALCLKIAEKLSVEALAQFPQAPLMATLKALEQEIVNSPRLTLYVNAPDEALQVAAAEAATLAGFGGQISFRHQPAYPRGAFEIAWHEGRAEFDPTKIYATIDETLKEALKAEQFHQSQAQASAHETI